MGEELKRTLFKQRADGREPLDEENYQVFRDESLREQCEITDTVMRTTSYDRSPLEEYKNVVEDGDEGSSSIVFLDTEWHGINCNVYGVSFLGRQHCEKNEHCQDFHHFTDLGKDWHLYVVSDGAGSAKASHRGAKINCEITSHLLQKLIDKLGWKNNLSLPSETEWQMEFWAICRMVRNFVMEKVESLDEPLEPKDFNATLLVLIVTPKGMLVGHIGDGRIGYKSQSEEWLSLITPHKGEEVNQTIFVMNPWDKVRVPALKMSGVFVPETKVVLERPQCVALLSDGCENFSWNCLQMDPDIGLYRDINTPFSDFWESLLTNISQASEKSSKEQFIKFVDRNTHACRIEEDDRTILLGIYFAKEVFHEIKDTDERWLI